MLSPHDIVRDSARIAHQARGRGKLELAAYFELRAVAADQRADSLLFLQRARVLRQARGTGSFSSAEK